MGKSSGLAVLALLIGIGGLGFGAYSYFIFSGQIAALGVQDDNNSGEIVDLTDQIVNLTNKFYERAVIEMLYVDLLEDWEPSVTNTNESVITVNFQVNAGERAYFLFVTRAVTWSNGFDYSFMTFRFSIDGIILNKPYTVAGGYDIKEWWLDYPVALQYSTFGLTAGNHNVSVMVLSSYSLNFIRHSSILIQIYI